MGSKAYRMRALILTATVIFLTTFQCFSQHAEVVGKLISESEEKPIPNAVVAIFAPDDSTLIAFTRVNSNGDYSIKNLRSGKYILMASHPLYADIFFDITVDGSTQGPSISLISKATLLQEVIVSTGAPIRVRGDTTIYTADSFQVSANANVEELLKKMPGIQVDKDGKIKAMGETVERVLVDGEEFFGDDPGMAVKNLRADAVKEVQVFNKKSEQAEFTGIDDGQTQKTINLKLKDDRKKGYFGKAEIAGGAIKDADPRYNANLLFSSFKGSRKASAFLLNGNTGQDGLSWEDEQRYNVNDYNTEIGDDGSIMIYSSSSDEEVNINKQNGFLNNLNSGMLYANKLKEKFSLNLAPKYNAQDYRNRTQTYQREQIGDSLLIRDADNFSHVQRNNFKFRAIAEVTIDSFNSLKVTANTNFYTTDNDETSEMLTTGGTGTLKNGSNRNLQSSFDKAALSGNLVFRHKFKKERRTLMFTGNWYSLTNEGTSFLKSSNTAFFEGIPSGNQDLDQKKQSESDVQNFSAQITYTEPLSKSVSLQLSYRLSSNKGSNDQVTYNYSDDSKRYEEKVDSLSNNFRQNIIQSVPTITFNISTKKLKWNVGSGFGFTNFDLKDVTFEKEYIRNYTNFYPRSIASYTYKPNHSIQFRYTGYTNQPSVDQLQPLRNNTDYFNQRIGNPDLKPSFSHTFNAWHQAYNFLKNFWTYQSVYAQFTQNAFATSNTVNLDSGKTISQTVNVNGNHYIGFNAGISHKIKKLKIDVDWSPAFVSSRYAQIINGVQSYSTTMTPRLQIGLNKSKEKRYEVYISNGFAYNINKSNQTSQKITYYTNEFRAFGQLYIKKVWSLSADYNYYYRGKTRPTDRILRTHLLNAKLQRSFHSDEFTAFVTVRDILDQNIGIDRSFYANTYIEVINQRLQRYFMVGFAWNFKNKAGK